MTSQVQLGRLVSEESGTHPESPFYLPDYGKERVGMGLFDRKELYL